MKKLIPLLLVSLLVLSSVGTTMVTLAKDQSLSLSETINFEDELVFTDIDGYLGVDVRGASHHLAQAGQPDLPVYRTTYKLPRDVSIGKIDVQVQGIKETSTQKTIAPAITPMHLTDLAKGATLVREKSQAIYEKDEMFPASWFDYSIRCGLDDGVDTTYVIVEVYPVRYNPVDQKLTSISNAEILVEYEDNSQPMVFDEQYDLVIIAPEEFVSTLQPLVDHKNDLGVRTFVKTVEDIESEYSGRDEAEQVKYFILDAKETNNITYALLAGGLKSYLFGQEKDSKSLGAKGYYVPARYTSIQSGDEKGCLSDLYYGDLYKYDDETEEWVFEDWDPNENGIFAEYTNSVSQREFLDLVPDVYVGRLAARSKFELKGVVNKIITYESTSPAQKPWYNHMVSIGGRTFQNYEGVPDGEYVCNVVMDLMDDSVTTSNTTCYVSNNVTGGRLPQPDPIVESISEGAGYVLFEGHGSPTAWNTNWREGGEHNWVGGMNIIDELRLKNGDELPVIVIGGCHNGLFNVSVVPMILALFNYGDDYIKFWTAQPTPVCFSWGFVAKPNGGAIASTGCTGYGIGGGEPITLSSELEVNLFYKISQDGIDNIGAAHGDSIAKFVGENTIRQTEHHVITIFQFFGDPSLKLGGYE